MFSTPLAFVSGVTLGGVGWSELEPEPIEVTFSDAIADARLCEEKQEYLLRVPKSLAGWWVKAGLRRMLEVISLLILVEV